MEIHALPLNQNFRGDSSSLLEQALQVSLKHLIFESYYLEPQTPEVKSLSIWSDATVCMAESSVHLFFFFKLSVRLGLTLEQLNKNLWGWEPDTSQSLLLPEDSSVQPGLRTKLAEPLLMRKLRAGNPLAQGHKTSSGESDFLSSFLPPFLPPFLPLPSFFLELKSG